MERKHVWLEMAGPSRQLSVIPHRANAFTVGRTGKITVGFKQISFLKYDHRWIQTASSKGRVEVYALFTLLLEVLDGKYIIFPFLQRNRSNSSQFFSVNTIN